MLMLPLPQLKRKNSSSTGRTGLHARADGHPGEGLCDHHGRVQAPRGGLLRHARVRVAGNADRQVRRGLQAHLRPCRPGGLAIFSRFPCCLLLVWERATSALTRFRLSYFPRSTRCLFGFSGSPTASQHFGSRVRGFYSVSVLVPTLWCGLRSLAKQSIEDF